MDKNNRAYFRGLVYTILYYALAMFTVSRFDFQSGDPSPAMVVGLLFWAGAFIWIIADLILIKKKWARGSITVHAAVIIYLVILKLAG